MASFGDLLPGDKFKKLPGTPTATADDGRYTYRTAGQLGLDTLLGISSASKIPVTNLRDPTKLMKARRVPFFAIGKQVKNPDGTGTKLFVREHAAPEADLYVDLAAVLHSVNSNKDIPRHRADLCASLCTALPTKSALTNANRNGVPVSIHAQGTDSPPPEARIITEELRQGCFVTGLSSDTGGGRARYAVVVREGLLMDACGQLLLPRVEAGSAAASKAGQARAAWQDDGHFEGVIKALEAAGAPSHLVTGGDPRHKAFWADAIQVGSGVVRDTRQLVYEMTATLIDEEGITPDAATICDNMRQAAAGTDTADGAAPQRLFSLLVGAASARPNAHAHPPTHAHTHTHTHTRVHTRTHALHTTPAGVRRPSPTVRGTRIGLLTAIPSNASRVAGEPPHPAPFVDDATAWCACRLAV